MRTPGLWRDPRTGIWMLRRRIPARHRAVADQKGDTVKITTGTADRLEALRRWPGLLQRWAAMEAEWDRRLNTVELTPERSRELAAHWAAWIAAGAPLETGGEDSDVFEPLDLPQTRTPEGLARMHARLVFHADEALRLAGLTAVPATRHHLLVAMSQVVVAAYLQADLRALGLAGEGPELSPFDVARARLPEPPDPPPAVPSAQPGVGFQALFDAWKAVAVVKPRTAAETRYALVALEEFLEHGDAARVARTDLARWRDALKADGRTNNTWNNRLSLLRQVFAFAADEGHLASNPADNGLRLRKNRTVARKPYTDDEAARILLAARVERSPSLRWAHWVMAFTGMRAGEVLQLVGGDVRRDGAVWFIDVNEDGPGKSVKSGQPRHVPVHPALLAEGFVEHARSVAAGEPLFPDKRPDAFGNRGGGAWNLVGKWVREAVGIADPAKAPDHSWRHRMEDELRAAGVYEADRDAILGHARKTTGRLYGVRGEALERLHRELSRVPSPLTSS